LKDGLLKAVAPKGGFLDGLAKTGGNLVSMVKNTLPTPSIDLSAAKAGVASASGTTLPNVAAPVLPSVVTPTPPFDFPKTTIPTAPSVFTLPSV